MRDDRRLDVTSERAWLPHFPSSVLNVLNDTDPCPSASAALSVCQARAAHFTRAGYSHTPEKTASLPSSTAASASSRLRLTHAARPGGRRAAGDEVVEASEERLGLDQGVALDRLRHHRGRRHRDRATGADEVRVPDDAVLDLQVDRRHVAAQRVLPVDLAVRVGQRAEVPRPLAVIEDHLLIELAQIVAHAKTSITFWIPSTRASTSARVL